MSTTVATPTPIYISAKTLELKLKTGLDESACLYEWRTQVQTPTTPPPTPITKEAIEPVAEILASSRNHSSSVRSAAGKSGGKQAALDNFMDMERQHSALNRQMNQQALTNQSWL